MQEKKLEFQKTLDTIIGYVTRIEAGDYPTVEVTGDVDKGRLIIIDSAEKVTAYTYCGKTTVPCELLKSDDIKIPAYMRKSN